MIGKAGTDDWLRLREGKAIYGWCRCWELDEHLQSYCTQARVEENDQLVWCIPELLTRC